MSTSGSGIFGYGMTAIDRSGLLRSPLAPALLQVFFLGLTTSYIQWQHNQQSTTEKTEQHNKKQKTPKSHTRKKTQSNKTKINVRF